MGLLDSFLEGMAEGSNMSEEEKKKVLGQVKGFEQEDVQYDNQNAQVYTLSAHKGLGGFKNYKTKVMITQDGQCTVSNEKVSKTFTKADVLSAEFKVVPVTTVMDIIRYAIALVLCLVILPVGIALAAASFVVSLLKAIVITLKDGSKIKIYYKNRKDAEALVQEIV